MKILIVGKYPPIEGGVSSRTYWLARSLGERGHAVSVITNAGRVEEEYRIPLDFSNEATRVAYRPRGVLVSTLKTPAPTHIPYSESYVSRLTSLALDAIAERGADVVFSFYLEPYGVAGLLVKELTGVPLVVQHAGSDVWRLLPDDGYRAVLGRVLLRADQVVLGGRLRPMARRMGIPASRIESPLGVAVPPAFSPEGARFALPGAKSGVPSIVYFGKAGRHKGLRELLDAVALVKGDLRLYLFTNGEMLPQLKNRIDADPMLRERVRTMDFVAPWVVPEILRSADLLLQLEHDFPVLIHSPIQPYEAIRSGTPTLLSAEIAAKITPAFPKTSGKFLTVQDPKDASALATALSHAVADRVSRKADAAAIREEFLSWSTWEGFVARYEAIFARASRKGLGRIFRPR